MHFDSKWNMERFITKKLLAWKQQAYRKPLIVRGARQVGKSYSIRHFGETYFEGKIHIVNLEKQLDWHKIFEPNLDVERIVMELEIVLNSRIDIGKDLLFFDEIQACPKAIGALRYFYEQFPTLHVIAAGSLLEFALEDISFPVGRVQVMNMYPMNFEEYLAANNKHSLIRVLHSPFTQVPESIHQILVAELKQYFFIGGMPECVKVFTETSKLVDVYQVQSDLIETYRQDFSKYTPYADKRCLNDVLSTVSLKVGQKIKYADLSDRFTNPTIKKAFHLLCKARLFHKVHSTSPTGIPLRTHISHKKFKAILLDIGLLSHLSGLSVQQEYSRKHLLAIFKGALAEQFVGQEFLAAGKEELYYWAREAKSSNAEVDYLVEHQGSVFPIEVKNSVSGRLKSLQLLLKMYPKIEEGIVFSDTNYGKIPGQKLTFLPLVCASKFLSA